MGWKGLAIVPSYIFKKMRAPSSNSYEPQLNFWLLCTKFPKNSTSGFPEFIQQFKFKFNAIDLIANKQQICWY